MKPRAWMKRFGGLFGKKRREQELSEEIESVLALHTDENIRRGMTPEEARRTALLQFGGVESAKEAWRDRSSIPVLEHVFKDIRFALRQLHRNPGFTATAVLVLALGICGSVAIYAFVDAALVKPIPYPEPNQLVAVNEKTSGFPISNLSYLDFVDWKNQNQVFRSFEAYKGSGYLMRTAGGTVPVAAARVTDGFFRTLGVTPFLGRDFYDGESKAGTAKSVILSYGCWRDRFGARTDVIGRPVILDGVPHTIAGVLPEHFQFAPRGAAELWTPVDPVGSCESRRSCHNLYGIARLKDGVSVEAALANMRGIAARLEQMYPGSNRGQGASVLPLAELIVGNVRPLLLLLLGGAGLLLLIACVNTASLVLVRSESRNREIAVRVSLGASALRLVNQFLVEAMVLVATATGLGLLLAFWGIRVLGGLIDKKMLAYVPFLQFAALNWRVLAIAGAIAAGAVLLLTLAPAVSLVRGRSREEGLARSERNAAGTVWRRMGANLVVVELAVAMVLLVGAGLLGQSFQRLIRVDLGFEPDHLATLTVYLPRDTYKTGEQIARASQSIVEAVTSLPGVESAGLTSILPVSSNGNTTWFRIAGKPFHGEHNEANERDVSVGYFPTVRAKLVRGRFFTESDDATRTGVVIINRTLARMYFGDEDPIGQQIGDMGLSPKSMRVVVGVVDDIRDGALDAEIWPAVYYPVRQDPSSDFSVLVRTRQRETELLDALVRAVHGVDPQIGTVDPTSMRERIQDHPSAYTRRSAATLLALFAALALMLGVIGFYGVTAYSVGRRTREIGIRMALGAQRGTVYRMVLGEAARLIAIGIAVGVLCSAGAARLAKQMLFGVGTWDVPTLVSVAAVLAFSALLASYVPARRAASVNPVRALNAE